MIRPLRKYRFSLRARATTWYVGLLAVALFLFSIGIYLGIRTYLKVALQRVLSSTAHTIADDYLAKLPTKGESWVLGEIREAYEASPTDHFIRVSTSNRVLFQTADMRDPSIHIDDISLPRPQAGDPTLRPPLIGDLVIPRLDAAGDYHRQAIHGKVVLIYTMPFATADGQLIAVETGASVFSMEQTLHSLAKILVIVTIPLLILAAIGGYLLMKQPLRPLVVLTDKAANIGRTALGERLPVIPTGDELERLTYSLNGMIDRLEEALDHNHRFSADASHELRTPLTIMRGEIEEMLRMEDLPSQAVENLVSTLEEIERMSRIVNSLMTITRLDAGGERMDMKVLDLSALVRTTMDHMRLLADEKGLPLSCACERGVHVYADPMRMKQVLVNLIDNAIKYTSTGSAVETLEEDDSLDTYPGDVIAEASSGVEVSVFAAGSQAHVKISDHGIDIASDVLPHVFERFYRADQTRSRGAGGVGLGLAIVKAIVTAHDGSVSITSTLGQGSTVLVQRPLASASSPLAPEESASEKKPQPRYQTI
jgi:signal transduction histidine kinase